MLLVICLCFSCHENPMGIPRHSFSFVIYMDILFSCSILHRIFMMKLFDVFFRLVFDPGERSLSTLIIRDWPIIGSKSHF